MDFTNSEIINLIKSCTDLNDKIIKNEILPTVLVNNNITFEMNSDYYVLPTTKDKLFVTIVFTFDNLNSIVEEGLIMNPNSGMIIDFDRLFYYISIPKILDKKYLLDWELKIKNSI